MNIRSMRAKCVGLAMLGVAAMTAGVARGDDKDMMQGTWKVTFAEIGTGKGIKQADANTLKGLGLVIEGDKLTLIEGASKEVVTFAIDPNTKTIEFFSAGSKKSKLYHGIYAFDGSNLKLCWGPAGAQRPPDFGARKQNRRRYYIVQQ